MATALMLLDDDGQSTPTCTQTNKQTTALRDGRRIVDREGRGGQRVPPDRRLLPVIPDFHVHRIPLLHQMLQE